MRLLKLRGHEVEACPSGLAAVERIGSHGPPDLLISDVRMPGMTGIELCALLRKRYRPERLSVPHMGWNQIHQRRPCPMLEGIQDAAYVYFAHSYHVVPADEAVTATTTDYGYDFASAIWHGNIFANQ